jgi:hypothetical protein
MSPENQKYLDNAFTYHKPKNDQPARYEFLRNAAKDFAALILLHVPESRERSLALTRLEECSMWANAGIARNE